MSEQHSLNIPAHRNIYTGSSDRELRIDFSTPDNGVNADTGLLVLVSGFGANMDSKVYKKMRDVFADQYNLVTILCNYFGNAFMQDTDNVSIDDQTMQTIFTNEELAEIKKDPSSLFKLIAEKDAQILVTMPMEESVEEFCDMGYMQAIDIIAAINVVIIILKDNGFAFAKLMQLK